MDDSRQLLILLLHALPGMGNASLRFLLSRFNSADEFWGATRLPLPPKATSSLAAALRRLWREGDSSEQFLQAISWQKQLEERNITLLDCQDLDYPPLLLQIPQPPAVLYVQGCVQTLCLPQLAIVGSRNASRNGLELASAFAEELVGMGVSVCSGLALGIDGAAHRSALDAQGITTAVLGTGLDNIYPVRHGMLAAEIAERGALLSEFPLGTAPLPGHFPRRNRIIAGLCLGTLVVEAALKSGSLITARLALDYNREVFAIPGSVHNPRCKGTHALIRQGAKLVETTEHILEEIQGLLQLYADRQRPALPPAAPAMSSDACTPVLSPPNLDDAAGVVLEAVDYHPTSVDLIAERCGLAVAKLSAVLLDLELSGQVEAIAGAYQRCR